MNDLLVMSPGPFTPCAPQMLEPPACVQGTHPAAVSSPRHSSNFIMALCTPPTFPHPQMTSPRRNPRSNPSTPRKYGDYTLRPQAILRIRNNSCSRPNFAKNVVEKLFSKEDRCVCNVKGVLGKKPFDAEKMAYVKDLTFEQYPAVPPENESDSWSWCVRAIDTASRQLIRKLKKENIQV